MVIGSYVTGHWLLCKWSLALISGHWALCNRTVLRRAAEERKEGVAPRYWPPPRSLAARSLAARSFGRSFFRLVVLPAGRSSGWSFFRLLVLPAAHSLAARVFDCSCVELVALVAGCSLFAACPSGCTLVSLFDHLATRSFAWSFLWLLALPAGH